MLEDSKPTPSLTSSTHAPIYALEKVFIEKQAIIAQWFAAQWRMTPPPIYGSVDLRNAGFKLAPIDMNLFPAGFNNLNQDFLTWSVDAVKRTIFNAVGEGAKNILVLPENHTRNLKYWSNIHTLKLLLEKAGFAVRFGWLDESLTDKMDITLEDGVSLVVEPLVRVDNRLRLHDFIPDFVLLNNDLSEGIPSILRELAQGIYPPAELGWSQRLKSEHFHYYEQVAAEFATAMDIDPWLISPLFRQCGSVDFMQQEGMTCLVRHAETLFAEIKQKYAAYGITHQPFLIVKADAGTYGMAVMTVRDPEMLKTLNRKQRTRMSTIKGGQPVNRVIIQEGVYTFETVGEEQAVAEPVVYLFGECVVGGFYRVHQDRGVDENLNSPGMRFEPLAFAKPCHQPCSHIDPDAIENRYYAYGLVAQLSMLAAAREIKELSRKE